MVEAILEAETLDVGTIDPAQHVQEILERRINNVKDAMRRGTVEYARELACDAIGFYEQFVYGKGLQTPQYDELKRLTREIMGHKAESN